MAARKQIKGSAQSTVDHDEIREWVESHGGQPAMVKRTRGKQPGILRIDFPGFSGKDTLESISWDEFFDKFEQAKHEKTPDSRVDSRDFSRTQRSDSARARADDTCFRALAPLGRRRR